MWVATSVDHDQTEHYVMFELGLHNLLTPICLTDWVEVLLNLNESLGKLPQQDFNGLTGPVNPLKSCWGNLPNHTFPGQA